MSSTPTKLKIATFDIEMFPCLGWFFGGYEVNPLKYEREDELASFAYQWLGQKKVHIKGRCDYKDKTDKSLAKDLWALFDEADILIGHNLDRFDIKKANSRFLVSGLTAPSHYRTIDTLKVIKKHFGENRNGLDHFCQKHGIGEKTHEKYHDLWYPCIQGDKTAWRKMKKYNQEDVRINAEMYNLIRPWIDNHPNLATMLDRPCCPNCGSIDTSANGYRFAQGTKYRRIQCNDCGAWFKQSMPKRGSGKISGK